MNKWLWLGVLLAVGAALALRCPKLEERPMHNDEAVNAVKFGELWEHGQYKYDPNEHHGPALFYSTLAVARLTSSPDVQHLSVAKLRLITVMFGVGLILLLPLVRDGLGNAGMLWAALFTAISPAMVFYSRYFIHEMLLVFATFLALSAGWRYWRSRRLGWALLAGVATGLMHATKETFVITLAAAAISLACSWAWTRWVDASASPSTSFKLNKLHLAGFLAVWVLVAFVLFSSFMTNLNGVPDSIRTFAPWLNRAEGNSPHIHPWNFYFERLIWFHHGRGPVWSEGLILLLAIPGARGAFTRRGLSGGDAGFARFLTLYIIALAAAYALISYKTPWCMLSFWHGTILLAGLGAAVVQQRLCPLCSRMFNGLKRLLTRSDGAVSASMAVRISHEHAGCIAVTILILASSAHLCWLSWQAGVTYAADPANPYVYAQTSPDMLELVDTVEGVAAASPDGTGTRVDVIATDGDYWPLPWYLRGLSRIGWWEKIPEVPTAKVVIVSPQFASAFDNRKDYVMAGFRALRPQVWLQLYVQTDLWHEYVSTREKR
jgi:uncharacterized protein (TIGR03663 family)